MKRLAALLVGLLALLIAGIGAGRAWLATAAGSRWLTGQVSEAIDRAIRGSVKIERVNISGLATASARGVRLFAPDGTPVLVVDSALLSVDLASLLGGEIVIRSLRAKGLSAEIVQAPGGAIPLAQAVEPKEPSGSNEEPSTSVLVIREAEIELGAISHRAAPGAEPTFVAESGRITGRLELREGALIFEIHADLSLAAPRPGGAAQAEVSGRYHQGALTLERFSATLPGRIRIEGSGSTRRPALPGLLRPAAAGGASALGKLLGQLRFTLTFPAGGLLKYGGPRLAGPVRVDARLRFVGERILIAAEAHPRGPGVIRVEGWAEPGEPGTFSARLDARGVDPSRILATLPRGKVWLTGRLGGSLAFPPGAKARGTLLLARSRLGGHPIEGRADFMLRGSALTAQNLDLWLPGARVAGWGRLAAGQSPTGQLHVDAPDLGALSQAARGAGLDLPRMQGELRLDVSAKGTAPERNVALKARARSVNVQGAPVRAFTLDLSLENGALLAAARADTPWGAFALTGRAGWNAPARIDLAALALDLPGMRWRLARPAQIEWTRGRLQVRDVVLDGPGKLGVSLDLPGDRRAGPLRGDIRLDGMRLEALEPYAPDLYLRGRVNVALELRGTAAAPSLEIFLGAEGASVGELPAFDARLEARAGPRQASARGWALVPGSSLVHLEASLTPRARGSLWPPRGLARTHAKVDVGVPTIDLAALARAGVIPAGSAGRARMDLQLSGPLLAPDIRARLDISGAAVDGLPPTSGSVELVSDAKGSRLRAGGQMQGAPPFHAVGSIDAPLPALRVRKSRAQARLRAELSTERGPIALPGATAAGAVLRARAWGSLRALQGELTLEASQLAARNRPVGDAHLEVRADGDRLSAALDLAPTHGGRLHARVDGPRVRSARGWTALFRAEQAHLEFLAILPQLRELDGGVADGALELRDAKDGPEVTGSLAVRAGRVVLGELGSLHDVVVRLEGGGRSLRIQEAAAGAGAGRASLEGALTWNGEKWATSASLDLDRFPMPTPARAAGFFTTRLAAELSRGEERVEGSLRLSKGSLRLVESDAELHPTELPPDIFVHEPGKAERTRAPWWRQWLARNPAVVQLHIPRGFRVEGEVANLELVADTEARWDGSSLALVGSLKAVRGHVSAMQRRFEIERLAVTFTGRSVVDPLLDGVLIYDHPDAEVTMILTGSLRAPEVSFRSNPLMDDAEIALLIATGRRTGDATGGGIAGTAAAGALNLIANHVRRALAEALPIDVLALELGPRGEARRFEAGAYVTPRLFLAFVRNLLVAPDQNTNEVQAEYMLGPYLSVHSRYGDRQSGALNLVYERRFRSGAQRRARR